MAKGKHSTALFEVIHNGKQQPERMAQRLRTPKWWFKGLTGSGEAAEAPTAAEIENDPTLRAVAAPPAPAPVRQSSYSPSGRSSVVHFTFDRDRQEITLRLRYTTAIVSTFFVCVVVAMAYVVGRHIGRGPQVASASEQPLTEQIRRQSPQQGVTDLPSHSRVKSPAVSPNIVAEQSHRTTQTPSPRSQEPQPPQPAATPGVEHGLPRSVNLNYVIIQSYPKDSKTAEKAREFLAKNGVPCTIESIPGYTLPSWESVVGTDGFAHTTSAECQAYLKRVGQLSEKFGSNRFVRFDPHAYKWREQ